MLMIFDQCSQTKIRRNLTKLFRASSLAGDIEMLNFEERVNIMRTKLFPTVQFKEKTWEIDEFDCASLYLLEGTEKAMLIDCGMGIGDLKGAVEMITDKPLYVVITHGHVDHTGNAWQFPELWINQKDANEPIPQSLERRKFDTFRIAQRQKGSIGSPYNMFNLYPFDMDVDLIDPGPDASRLL